MSAIWAAVKNVFGLISRVMKLEERVSVLEKKIDSLQAPQPDVRDGLQYNKNWNYHEDARTGECFCPTCLGNGKKIAVKVYDSGYGQRWDCSQCKAWGSE